MLTRMVYPKRCALVRAADSRFFDQGTWFYTLLCADVRSCVGSLRIDDESAAFAYCDDDNDDDDYKKLMMKPINSNNHW